MGPDDSSLQLFGRDREIAELGALVARSRALLVYGAAGVGKTTLVRAAIERAASEKSIPPLAFVSLEGVTDPREAVTRAARAVGATRPERAERPEALAELLAEHTRTLVLDDIDTRSRKLAPIAQAFAERHGASRLVFVSRRFFTAKEAMIQAPVYEVKPLEHAAAVALVRAVEVARGCTLADDVADASGGNPMLIRLALAGSIVPRAPGDATAALRRAVEEHASGDPGEVMAVLSSAGAALDETEVIRVLGKKTKAALDELRKHLIVVRDGLRVAITPPAAPIVREIVGEAPRTTWKAVLKIADAMLAAQPSDATAVIAAARARLETNAVDAALEILATHPLARASADPSVLERLLRDVASRSGPSRGPALRMLAREQLRAGDYEQARRSLDELPKPKTREEAVRLALLRAECHVRVGEPGAALRVLDAIGAPPAREQGDPALVLTRAQLAILGGDLDDSRAALEKMAPATAKIPSLEARRAVQIAASWLYQERYELTHEWVLRARAAQQAAGLPVEPVATILDVHALLGLGEIERAEGVIAREARGRPHAPMLEVATLVRRGEHARAIEVGAPALASLDRRADLLFRSVVARDLVRAAMALGNFAQAARMLRLAEAGADEPGLAALRPICDAEHARLAEARGEIDRAAKLAERAFSKIPRSPFVAADRAALAGRAPDMSDRDPPAFRAYALLRSAEVALQNGALQKAAEAAEIALAFYSGAGFRHDIARAELLRGEAFARQGDFERADHALGACEAIARPQGYAPLAAMASLVRAAIADARGDLEAEKHAIEAAVRFAGDGVDGSLVRAAARVGVGAPEAFSATRTYERIVERLGLAKPGQVVWKIGARTWLRSKGDPPPETVVCALEVDDRIITARGGKSMNLPEQRVALLCALAEAGERGATLEELFERVWRAKFHPLRHRNAVYVALTRLKDSLKPLAKDVRISLDGERYRLAGPVGVIRSAERALMNGR